MNVLRAVILLPLLAVCCFSPGFFLVRRWRWTPLEKLCASAGLSLIFLYLASAAIYGLGFPWAISCWCISGASTAMLAIAWPDARRLIAVPSVRKGLYGYGFLLLWTLVVLSMIRVYSGAGWGGDWVEHFQRSLYFLNRFPTATPIVGGFQVPARPPMMNLLGAFFMALAGSRFEVFQTIFVFLNLLVFLAGYLTLPAIAFHGRRRILPLCVLFAASPLVIENATYTWTKMLAAFYVILAFWFYLRGWSKQSTGRMTAAFAFLAAGMLVHYSTGPYLLFITLHYVVAVFWKRRNRWPELAAVAGVGGLLLATWLVWSVAVYGAHSTVASNTAVTATERAQGGNLAKIAGNFFDTIVPYPLRSDAPSDLIRRQTSSLGRFRDYVFPIYQSNAIFGMGSLGGIIAIYLLGKGWRGLWRRPWGRLGVKVQRFWFLMVSFCLVAGIAVHGERVPFGVAHVTLQPLMLLGLCFLAGSFSAMPRVLAWITIAGCLLDFAVGVVPQTIVESMENTPDQVVFAGPALGNGRVVFARSLILSDTAWNNWYDKHQLAAASSWFQALPALAGHAPPQVIEQARTTLLLRLAEDPIVWQGWFSRHNGETTFLGDWVAGGWPGGIALPMTCLVAMFIALMGGLVREIPKPASVKVRELPQEVRRKKGKRRGKATR